MEEHVETPNEYGIFIVDRRLKSVVESINQLADYMFGFSQLCQSQRIQDGAVFSFFLSIFARFLA